MNKLVYILALFQRNVMLFRMLQVIKLLGRHLITFHY